MDYKEEIGNNIAKIERQIDAAIKEGRWQQPVKLLAVSKNHPAEAVLAAANSGLIDFAENRVQEAKNKIPSTRDGLNWHLIGHLQTNKAMQAVKLFDVIHSLDSERLALAINQAASKIDKQQQVLLQVNVAEEQQKFGINTTEAISLARFIGSMSNLQLCGLMVMAPFYEDAELARPVFRQGRKLFEQLSKSGIAGYEPKWLSMGMSNDFSVAIDEGANIVRIGTAIFGEREY